MTSPITNSSLPLVSIMISSYRQIQLLEKAISSALMQDYSNLEIIISDDSSGTCEVLDLIAKFNDPRLQLNINKNNLGRAKNYRVLLNDLAKGKYVTLLNGDDYFIDNTYISTAVNLLDSDESISLVFGGVEKEILSSGERLKDTYHDKLDAIVDGNWYFINYPKGFSIPHVSSVYRRQEAIDIDFYRINSMSQDWESFLRIILNKKIAIVKKIVAIKTQHQSNVTKTKELSNFKDNAAYLYIVHAFVKNLDIFSPQEIDDWLNKLLRRHHTKWLIKIWFLSPSQEKSYLDYLKKTEPLILKQIIQDPKFICYKIIRQSKTLMRLAFKYVIKQESFIADLQEIK